jgi:organic radical activating enzyme
MSGLAFVSEIYASVQGEGPFTGERQIFVRLAGCPLRCRYCDTPASLTAQGHPQLTLDQVMQQITDLRDRAGTVSVTGGEPLMQAGFVADLFIALKKRRIRTYLETGGVHAQALKKVVAGADVISMDIKLPSAVGRSYWKEHGEFLAVGGKKIFVKIVWEAASQLAELKKAVALLSARPTPPLLVLQPVSAVESAVRGPAPEPATAEHLADAYALAARALPRVLVMPQQHKIWAVR